jgi:hypothetical protein
MARAGKSRVLNEFNLHVNSGRLYRMLSGMEAEQLPQTVQADLEFWQNERGRAC